MTTVTMMTLTSAGRQGVKVNHQDRPWPVKNHARWAQVTPPNRQKATSPLHLSSKGENLAGPPRVGLDSRAEEEDT